MKSSDTKKKLRFETLEQRQMLTVVINEIHYNSQDNTKAEEFVELHNTGASAVDLSGWAFTDGIDYTFEPGTQIAAGGYLVVAQDPATLLAEYGAVSIGPFSGKLSNEGENIELSDNLGNVIDEVEYKVGFPWPIASSGGGGSMELINPELDNNLGSNWRPSTFEPLFPAPEPPVASAGALDDLVHRWSFNGDLTDSVGGATATLIDPQLIATLSSTQLDVSANNFFTTSDQTPFTQGAYIDLPNGIISAVGDSATFEWWGTVTFNRTWAEIFSFGDSRFGEDTSDSAANKSYVTLIPESGDGELRITHRNGAIPTESHADDNSALSTNVEHHIAVTWDDLTNTQSLYLDGQFIDSSATIIDLTDLNDVNNWLGRSQWNDPLFDGYHNEFRIYNRALTSTEVADSYLEGPDVAFSGPSINSFDVNESEILLGESATLSWDVSDFTSLSIDNGIGDVTGITQIVVSPSVTTTYELTATNASGVSTRNVTLTVNVPPFSPGSQNNVFAANAAPSIRQVKHDPAPVSGTPATITAKVTDPDGVDSVTLQYQVVLPGQYIPSTLSVPVDDLIASNGTLEPTLNPDYVNPANWTSVVMVDDGTGGDAVAGDDIYTAMVPSQAHRTLVRYKIDIEDNLGAVATVPYEDDASLNFAYFVYDGVPEYRDNSNQVVADIATLNSVPVYHFLTDPDDMQEVLAYDGSDEIGQSTDARFSYNWAGTMVYDGVVYDNIHYRLRGANGRYLADGKRSMRFRFNDGSYFQAYDQDGIAYPEKWRTLTTGKGFDNRETLTYSLNEAVTLAISNLIGVPAAQTHWFQFRVIDSADEAPNQWDGDFWGLNFVTETYDKRFLDAHDLEAGNLYKLINERTDAERQQRYQAPNAVDDGSDHDYIEQILGRNSNDIEHRVNLEKYYLFHSLVEMVRHYDFWPSANKNMVYYFEPDYLPENDNLGKLWLLPWDTDASWGPTWNAGEDVVFDALFNNNNNAYKNGLINPEYYNTLRELRDLVWQPDQLQGMIEELASTILPLEAADRARWQGAPDASGNYDGLGGAGAVSISNLINDMMNFAFVGGSWPGGSVGAGGRAAYLDSELANSGEEALIPFTPTITYTGDPGFASDGLSFQTTAFSDPQGNHTFGAVQWRISEITSAAAGLDPNTKFLDEFTASWDSGALTTSSTVISPDASTVNVGGLHRARVRFQDDTGRWSHWSAPTEFVVTEPIALPSITITELHYNPLNPALADEKDQEFIEILNTGTTTVDLSGVQITEFSSSGFTFDPGTSLGAGEYIVVARTPATFQSVYGTSINMAATGFGGSLSDGGETVSLLAASGAEIVSFTYDDNAPWPEAADGDGSSLEIIDPFGDHSSAANWRASSEDGGSPGYDGLALALPGDYNTDGQVDGFDFLTWQRSFGSTVNPGGTGADGSLDSGIDGDDLTVWEDNYGTTLGVLTGGQIVASSVPEALAVAPVSVEPVATTQPPRETGLLELAALQSASQFNDQLSQSEQVETIFEDEELFSSANPNLLPEIDNLATLLAKNTSPTIADDSSESSVDNSEEIAEDSFDLAIGEIFS